MLSHVRLFATPWTAAYQAPLSMGFSKQEYWSGVPLPSPSGPITSWQIGGETMGIVTDFIFLGSKITADGDCSREIKRHLLPGRKVMTNLDSIFGEGNGTPLQYSCLENPRDGGVWWASDYGVAQSRTRLK